VIHEVKRTASEIQGSSELWDLEHYLTTYERRKQTDRKYDCRYSQLTLVLRRLLYEHRLSEEDLRADCVKTRCSQSVLSPNSCGRAQPDLHAER
jgi:hypothetical protein